jgi:hypothetical protein
MINIFIEKRPEESFKSDNEKGYCRGIIVGKTMTAINLNYALSLKDDNAVNLKNILQE